MHFCKEAVKIGLPFVAYQWISVVYCFGCPPSEVECLLQMGVVSIKQPKQCLITYPVVLVVCAGSSQSKIAVTYDIAVLSHDENQ